MAEEGRSRAASDGRPLPALVDAVKRLNDEIARQHRLYEDAHLVHEALGGTIHDVMNEVAGLAARREALAKEIGALEAQLITLKADVAKAKA